jgi:serine/threonine protein kinase
VKLADFGIAKRVREPGGVPTNVTLMQSGARLGTPHYMAPE